jgi:hypothetical protein
MTRFANSNPLRIMIVAAAAFVAALAASHSASAAFQSNVDFGATGRCSAGIATIPGTGVGQPAGIIIDQTPRVSVVNTSGARIDRQHVILDLFLYEWNGSAWAYDGHTGQADTYVGEDGISTTDLWSGTNALFMQIPRFGVAYKLGIQIRWYDRQTGAQVNYFWDSQMKNLLGYDVTGANSYDWHPYCDFRVGQAS